MKRMFLFGIAVLAISFGLTACGEKGGTIKLINDTLDKHWFEIRFDGNYVRVNDGQDVIYPSQTIQAVSDDDTSYAVYIGDTTGFLYWNGRLLSTGQLSGGNTIELRFSNFPGIFGD